jgi:glucose-6-phosphate isomerase
LRNAQHAFAPSVSLANNDALDLAGALYLLEQQDFIEIFFAFYSVQAFGFGELASQLYHESVCKDEAQGQTMISLLAPESQHHFSQRFYGGRPNMVGLYLNVGVYAHAEMTTTIPDEIADLPLRDGTLRDIHGIPVQKGIHFEYESNKQDTIERGIPLITLELDRINEESTAELMALLQYMGVYSSWLRGVDPFDQPHVETSKELGFQMRKGYKR